MAGGRLCKIAHQYIFACLRFSTKFCQFTFFNSAMAWTRDTQQLLPHRCVWNWLLRCCRLKIPFMHIHLLGWPTQGWFMPATYLKFETLNCFTTLLLQLQMDCAKFDITIEEESWIGENHNFHSHPNLLQLVLTMLRLLLLHFSLGICNTGWGQR